MFAMLLQSHRDGVLFSYAFRPFFLLTGVYAVLIAAAWGLFLGGALPWPNAWPASYRHGHEMIFGFAGAAIAGFLLTAVATWTQRPPVSGLPLQVLGAVWFLARIAAFLPGETGLTLWAGASLSFWGGLTGLMAREVLVARNERNYKVPFLLLGFLLAEILFFVSARDGADGVEGMRAGQHVGLFLVLGMISLVGGRVIPGFTQNWLRLRRPEITLQLPPFDRFDLGAVIATALFAVGFVLWPQSWPTGGLGLIAALLQAIRLVRWRGWLAWRDPLLWVLHLGYGWIPVGFALLGAGILSESHGVWDSGLHALSYGAIGTLILGVAARVALGHTGRPLRTFPTMTAAFGLITAGTVLRLMAEAGEGLMSLSVLLWMGAWLLFLVQYTPLLLAPRIRS
jgi:uncharacterized protein involved in response to NO